MKYTTTASLAATLLAMQASASAMPPPIKRAALSASPVPQPPENPTNRVADDPAAQQLGQALFFDPNLSSTRDVSCATCHDPARAFGDGKAVAEGLQTGTVNTPTILGTAHHRWLFLDGRADTLWSQALGPIENDLEMGGARTDVVRYVASTPHLARAFTEVFGSLPDVSDEARFPEGARPGTPQWDAMTEQDRAAVTRSFVNLGKSIEAYERLLQPGESDFDRWVASIRNEARDDSILGEAAVRGFTLFAGDAGCMRCHFGPMLSDLEFHDLGIPPRDPAAPPMQGRGGGYSKLRASEFRADGPWSDAAESSKARRAAAARIGPEHWGAIRTPTLRNVAHTAPYMHAGQFATLSEVLQFYNTLDGQVRRHSHAEAVLVPLNLSDAQLADLETFVRTLSGDPPADALRHPPEGFGISEP
ncbi:MAG: cytochrome c peroxidase [Phycisphaerales bacterium]|jgi:cytochrome c peroxidase|nr:cytochrome c peroxidase [Phycisphaerales bacterium]